MSLSEEARAKRNEYQREWRRKNPEKVRQYSINYWNNVAKREEKEKNN